MCAVNFNVVDNGACEKDFVTFGDPYSSFKGEVKIALLYELDCWVGT